MTRDATPQKGAPSSRARRFADVTLGVAVLLCLSQIHFAIALHRPALLRALPAALAVLFALSFLLRPARRLTLALALFPAMILVYGFEWRLSRKQPYGGTAAEQRGAPFDARSLWEVIRDARAEGMDAYPSLQPRALLVLDISKGIWPDELQNRTLSETWGVVVGGERVLPLGGVSNKHVVYCNEGGQYARYESDEHGFNNPKGLWQRESVDVALVGDSFMHAACVGAEENAAHWIRQRHPATVNVGMAGNGPLIELATLEEFVAPKRPKVVFWVYYNNDMTDLAVERRSPLLLRYLEEEGFTQGLAAKQAEIDAALVDLAGKIEVLAPRWPSWLETVGVTRRSAPLLLGDLVMNESHSSTTAVIRLDRLAWGLTSLTVPAARNADPDYALFSRVLARAKARVESWGGRMIFVYMADMFYLQYKGQREHPARAGVLSAVKDLGIPIADAQQAFFAVDDQLTIRFHPGSHCNPAGYRLLSEVMLKALD